MPELVGGPFRTLLNARKLKRKYGLSVTDVAEVAKGLGYNATGDWAEPTYAATAIALAVCELPGMKEKVEEVGEIDWEQFFQGLIELIEILLPLIIQIISLFL